MSAFNLQPNLKGKILGLRPLLPSDFEELYAVSSDPHIWELHPERHRHHEKDGHGYNQEMKSLMLNHAFQYVNEARFYIGENNYRSRRAIEKTGAKFIEKIERQPLEGERYTSVVYGIKNPEWESVIVR